MPGAWQGGRIDERRDDEESATDGRRLTGRHEGPPVTRLGYPTMTTCGKSDTSEEDTKRSSAKLEEVAPGGAGVAMRKYGTLR